MNRTLKVLSLLLAYPEEEVKLAAAELISAVTAEKALPDPLLNGVTSFIEAQALTPIDELQERYVLLFDRTRSLALHLFEHVHGEGRDRGQAMVDLMSLYESRGYQIEVRELPDYLPLFLEFAAAQDDAAKVIGEASAVLDALADRHTRRGTAFAPLFAALAHLAAQEAGELMASDLAVDPQDDPNDLEALDAVWEAEAVRFGAGDALKGSCGAAATMN